MEATEGAATFSTTQARVGNWLASGRFYCSPSPTTFDSSDHQETMPDLCWRHGTLCRTTRFAPCMHTVFSPAREGLQTM